MDERYKTCGKCIHDGDSPDVKGSPCYLCRRNPTDNRIDWFEDAAESEICEGDEK